MRIDAFELDCIFRTEFTLAEVINGRAAALRLVRIRNIRGTESSWLHLRMELDGEPIRQKAVRSLPVGADERAAALEQGMMRDMVLPEQTAPGSHMLRLLITGDQDSQELLSPITVLPSNVIPTDFVRAPLLPAYVRESDLLRNFASGAIQHLTEPGPETVARCVYEALLEKKLMFQPVSGRQYPDCQKIAAISNVLQHGGSCAELSLLYASLLWNIGQAPALLLFEDHMAAGCFLTAPAFRGTLNDPKKILWLIERGGVLLLESTSLCHLNQYPFEVSRREILLRLQQTISLHRPCMLIDVQSLLRQGLRAVPEGTPVRACSSCGYSGAFPASGEAAICPACGASLIPGAVPEPEEVPDEPIIFSTSIQYALQSGTAIATRLRTDSEEQIRVMEVWEGRTVTGIGERAFAKSSIRAAVLPDTITRIGDYAFAGCRLLRRFTFPPAIKQVSTGAFQNSGLQTICIPGSIQRVCRLSFSGCSELSSVTLSDGIQFIDEKAFDGCVRLSFVTIPASVRQVARNAFPPKCRLILISQSTKIL